MPQTNLDAYKYDQTKTVIDTSKKVKVGFIGTGWIANDYIPSFRLMPDVEIVAGADLIPGKAEAFFKEHNIENAKCYKDHKELIDAGEVDAVCICTYNSTHAECAIYALEHGVHVLLEKPMCVTLEEAVAICKAEKKSGKILSLGFQPRFDNSMKLIKKIVQSGTLGDIYYIQTGGGRRNGIPTPFGTSFIEADKGGIGAVGDIGCYSLDMVLNAVGYPKPLTVSGYTSSFHGKDPDYFTSQGKPAEYSDLFGVDDFAAAFVRLEGGIILDFRIAWAMHIDAPCDTIFLGTKGGLRVPAQDCWNDYIREPLKLYQRIGGIDTITEIQTPEPPYEGCFYHKIRAFIDAIKEGGVAPVPTSEIIKNQAIIDAINKSSELRKEVEVIIPEI